MKDIDFELLNISKHTNKELLKDYINRWGNAQVCDFCGWVSPYGPYSHRLNCCGEVTRLVLEQENTPKEIKPCPFCGGKGEVQTEGEDWGSIWVQCQSCGAEGAWIDTHDGKTEDDAINKWNTRV